MKTFEHHWSSTDSLGYRLSVSAIVIGLLIAQNVTSVFAHGIEETQPNPIYLPTVGTGGTSHEQDHEDEDIPTAEEHFEQDNVIIDLATETRLAAEMYPGHGMRPVEAAAVTDPGVGGSWSGVQQWPVAAIHASLLTNGKVLAFDTVDDRLPQSHNDHTSTRAILWDPATSSITRVDVDTGSDLFCSGHAHLPDGSLYVIGGTLNTDLSGIDKTHIFNQQTNRWSLDTTMYSARWYPTVTPLATGEMLLISGYSVRGTWPYPEVRSTTGSLRGLSNATLKVGYYPWMQTAPTGNVFMVGPQPHMRRLNTDGAGTWQYMAQRDNLNRLYGSYAMYDIGKFIVSGGGQSETSTITTDINSGKAITRTTSPMSFGRRQHNLTILADGMVLATGGNSSGAEYIDMDNGVYAAELWNPATGQWTTLNSMQVTRQYHSTALLLPDGRVLSAGGGFCADCVEVGYLAKDAEVFSPPYLFKKDGSGELAARPVVDFAPSSVGYNANFTVQMQGNGSLQKVGLVRLGSVTHSTNMEQRYIPLQFTQASSTLQVTSPANGNIAPPGYYMLFVINSSGVPSVAKMVQVASQSSTPPQDDLIFADGFEAGNLTAWSARVINGGDLAALPAATLVGSYGMRAQINDNNVLYVTDDRPNGEKHYRARFHFDPNSIVMAQGDTHELFRGFVGTSLVVLRLQLRYYNGNYQARVGLLNDSTTWYSSSWFSISDAPHSFEVDWQAATAAGASNGALTFWIDGVQRSALTGVDNDTRQIDRVRLGAVSSLDTGTRGTYYFDAFHSGRLNYIGPATSTTLATVSAADLTELHAWTEEEMTAEDMQPSSEAPELYLPLLNN